MASAWTLELLGRFRLVGHGSVVTRFATRKVAMLLAQLALAEGRPPTRDELIETLWPDADTEQGRRSLRVALTHLRRVLEIPTIHRRGDVLLADRLQVAIEPGSVTTDVALFLEAVRAAKRCPEAESASRWELAVGLYGGEFMPGFYDDWVLRDRDRLQMAFLDAARFAALALRAQGSIEAAIRVAKRASGVDPADEANQVLLIELLLDSGQIAAAALECHTALREIRDQGASPSPDLQRLANRLGGDARNVPPQQAARLPSGPSDTSADRSNEHSSVTPRGLPMPTSRTFGREDEVVRLVRLLTPGDPGQTRAPQGGRLVTLTGPGGVGKTRLAIDAAWVLSGSYAGRVCFVPLADLTDPALVGHQVARCLGASGATQSEALRACVDHIGPGPFLLVLDNAEHLPGAVSAVVTALLQAAASLRIIVTSRRRMAAPGETVLPVRPLVVPPRELPVEAARDYPSVRMFVDRATSAYPSFQVTPRTVPQIAALCQSLDGLPLAIELAAARVSVLPPGTMVERIADRLDWLASSAQHVAARQRSLWAAIDWSYGLLSPDLRRFLTHVSVFRGGWTIDAAERICAEPSALDYTARLCECSLAQPTAESHEPRFALMETIREFAAAKLSPQEREGVQTRHAAWYLRMARTLGPRVADVPDAARSLDSEVQNIRAALEWLLLGLHIGSGARMVASLVDYWDLRGMSHEGLRWATAAAANANEMHPSLAYGTLRAAGRLATLLCDFATAEVYCRRALEVARNQRSHVSLARPLTALSHLHHMQGRYPESIAAAESARAHAAAESSAAHEAAALNQLVEALAAFGDFRASADRGREALSILRRVGGRRDIVGAAILLAETHMDLGEFDEARPLLLETETICREFDDRPGMATVLRDQGAIALDTANYVEARRLFGQSQELWAAASAPEPLADLLLRRSEVSRRSGDLRDAADLAGQALDYWRQREHRRWTAAALCQMSCVCFDLRSFAEARDLADEATDLLRTDPSSWVLHQPDYHLGRALLRLGDGVAGATALRRSLRTRATVGLRLRAIDACEALALALASLGLQAKAAALLGCAHSGRLRVGVPVPACNAVDLNDLHNRLRAELGGGRADDIMNRGKATPIDRVEELL